MLSVRFSFLFKVEVIALIAGLSFVCETSRAQLDPNSALLLNGTNSSTREAGLESGRYQIRQKKEAASPSRKAQAVEESTDPQMVMPAEPLTYTVAPPVVVQPQAAPILVPAKVVVQPQPQPMVKASPEEKSLVRRDPLLEISLAPGFVYTNSDSAYSFRRYTSAAPTASASANVWLQPTFALQASYMTTLSGNVSDSPNNTHDVAATQEWFTLGFRTKKNFGPSILEPSMVFGLDYSNYEFKVPETSFTRNRIYSRGAKLTLEADVPTSESYAWMLGFTFMPKLSHREGGTDAKFETGAGVEANSIGLSLGGKIRFEQSDAMFWKLSYSLEKAQYTGEATVLDPSLGVKPSGVSVTNTSTFLQFGYTWSH